MNGKVTLCLSPSLYAAFKSLSNEQRTIATIASLVTLGTEPQLELHINTGLTIGLTPKEIVGTIVHLIPYTGFPRVLNALKIVKKVFAQRNVTMNGQEKQSH
ncbi:alkylhydroperoxidase/carboxymuconolactone decarboxylase family protein YurZ [Neobacillus niacini]|nr:alkylhydroperoxidase/carboxymuconolactone decarboxylase family protein YurZ [Neobacillus niacini]